MIEVDEDKQGINKHSLFTYLLNGETSQSSQFKRSFTCTYRKTLYEVMRSRRRRRRGGGRSGEEERVVGNGSRAHGLDAYVVAVGVVAIVVDGCVGKKSRMFEQT